MEMNLHIFLVRIRIEYIVSAHKLVWCAMELSLVLIGSYHIPHIHYYISTESIDFCCFLFLFFFLACASAEIEQKKISNKNTTNVALQYNSPYDFLGAFSHKPFRRFIHSVFFSFPLLLQNSQTGYWYNVVREDSSWREREKKTLNLIRQFMSNSAFFLYSSFFAARLLHFSFRYILTRYANNSRSSINSQAQKKTEKKIK